MGLYFLRPQLPTAGGDKVRVEQLNGLNKEKDPATKVHRRKLTFTLQIQLQSNTSTASIFMYPLHSITLHKVMSSLKLVLQSPN